MSSSNSNASNTFQTPDMVSKIAYITPKSLSRRTEPDTVDRFDQENAEPSLETGSASPTRASRLDTPFAKIFSPLRRVPSSRQPFLCSKPNSLRFRGDDLVQDLARSVQPSVIKDSHTEIYEPFLFNPITNLFDEGKTPVMSKKELSRARRSGSAASPTITRSSPVKRVPSIVSPKSRRSGPRYSSSTTHCSSDRSEGDPVQDLARQLEVPAVKSPPPSPKEAKPSASVPAAVASPTENGDGSALSATPKPGSEGSTSDLALLTDKPQPSEDASKSEEPSPLPEKETSPSRRCKRKLMDDDDETEEEEIRTNINKRWKSDLEIFDRKATLQENVYDLESLLGGADEFYSFDNINEIWVTQEEELNDVDDPSNWGNDRTSTIESILPYSLKWNECKSQTSTAAAPLSADELYIKACTKLREYKALVDSRANVDAQCKARDEMAEAWRRWRHQSSDFVTIGDLKRYGEVLDMEGRQAIADALEVESSLLQAWVEEPFLRETRERKRKEGKAASTLKARATDSTPQPIDFSLYVNFGNDEEDIKSLNRTNAYPLSNLPFILPPPPPPTVTTLAAIPIVAQAIPTLVPQGTLSSTGFSKTPGTLADNRVLPKWAKGVLYCNSYLSLRQWMEDRVRELVQKSDVLEDKKEWLLNELYGPPRSDLTRSEKRISASTRVFNGLPDEQKPVLLHGKTQVEGFTKNEYHRDFVVVCRLSFDIDGGTIHYTTRPCGHVVTSNDILIRHVAEQHFKLKRKPNPRTSAVAETEMTPETPETPAAMASAAASETVPNLASKRTDGSP